MRKHISLGQTSGRSLERPEDFLEDLLDTQTLVAIEVRSISDRSKAHIPMVSRGQVNF